MKLTFTRRHLTAGILAVALVAGAVGCGGDDSSSDLSRDELLAILAAAQIDQNLVTDLTDEQLGDVVDQLLQGLDQADQPSSTDSTVAGTEPVVVDSQPAPVDSMAPTDDGQTMETEEEQGDAPTPSSLVIITLPNQITIPIGNIMNIVSTLAIADLAVADEGGIRTFSITVTEAGLGVDDISSVKVKWVVDGFETPLTAQKSSDVSATKSIWTVKAEAGPANLIVTARDENGKEVSRSFVLSK